MHLQLPVADHHAVDAVRRARIGQRGARDQLQRRGEPSEQFVGDALRDQVEIFQRVRSPGPPWRLSGPCGSDRLDTSSTSSGSAPAHAAMQYRSQSRVKQPAKLARRLLLKARAENCKLEQPSQWALRRTAPDGRSGVRGKPYGKSDTDHQQQELLVLVAARLAADEVLRTANSTRSSPRPTMRRRGPKSCCCPPRSWCRACGTRAPPYGTRWRSPNISTRSCPMPACCRRTASCGRIAARSAAKSIPGSRRCAPRCRST